MMQRLTVRLGDIKPNPFRQQIQGGHLDKAKLARVAESIKDPASGRTSPSGGVRLARLNSFTATSASQLLRAFSEPITRSNCRSWT